MQDHFKGGRSGHRVKLRNDICHGAVVRWSDVEVDANNDAIKTRRAMEAAFSARA